MVKDNQEGQDSQNHEVDSNNQNLLIVVEHDCIEQEKSPYELTKKQGC